MKTGILLIVGLGLLGAPPPASASDRECRGIPGGYTPGHEQTLLLTAAGTLFPETRGVVDSTLGSSWVSSDPVNLAGNASPVRLEAAAERICSWLDAKPLQERNEDAWRISAWMQAYRAVEVLLTLLNVEGLGSAVALQPDTRPLFPRDESDVARLGARAGETLASGENSGLWYRLATFLGSRSREERARIVEDLLKKGRAAYPGTN